MSAVPTYHHQPDGWGQIIYRPTRTDVGRRVQWLGVYRDSVADDQATAGSYPFSRDLPRAWPQLDTVTVSGHHRQLGRVYDLLANPVDVTATTNRLRELLHTLDLLPPWLPALLDALADGRRVVVGAEGIEGRLSMHGRVSVPRFDEFDPDESIDVYSVLPLLSDRPGREP